MYKVNDVVYLRGFGSEPMIAKSAITAIWTDQDEDEIMYSVRGIAFRIFPAGELKRTISELVDSDRTLQSRLVKEY